MKTSTKILITAIGVIIVAVIIGLFTLRNDLQQFLVETEMANNYKTIPVDRFSKLDFSTNWDVRIRQGVDYKLQISDGTDAGIENMDGTLYLKIDHKNEEAKAKITVPSLSQIRAVGNTRIEMKDFANDSLEVILTDSAYFRGIENLLEYVSFKSSGKAQIELFDDPDI